jgi:hypothetical protein
MFHDETTYGVPTMSDVTPAMVADELERVLGWKATTP